MENIKIESQCKKILADLYTPVGIYLRIRDRFPGSILLESADNNAGKNSFSYIAIKPIAGIEVKKDELEYKYPGKKEVKSPLAKPSEVSDKLFQFINSFQTDHPSSITASQSFFGYTAYDAVGFFEDIALQPKASQNAEVPLLRYRLYQYVIAIDHFKNELFLCENKLEGLSSEFDEIETLIRIKDCPVYSFSASQEEESNLTDAEYKQMVQKGIEQCQKKNIDQIVVSRSFSQKFKGDEFNVYRCLRSINPSPYLFYFDYNDYKLMGSSPESQLVIKDQTASISPIAGTIRRTGDEDKDRLATEGLLRDPKENNEHDMLVELARSELKKFASDIQIAEFRKVHAYSHVIHLVSKVTGQVPKNINPFKAMADSFPAGTLTGAPKNKAIALIDQYEPTSRGFYGGCIGIVGLNGDFNHAIMIRSFLCKNNILFYQAGAGVVDLSTPEGELQEVNNKLNALKAAIEMANTL